jgi:hypothetical protein
MLKENAILMKTGSSLRVCEYGDPTGNGQGLGEGRWEIPVMVDGRVKL